MRLYKQQGSNTSLGFTHPNGKGNSEVAKSQPALPKVTQEFTDSHLKHFIKKGAEEKFPGFKKPYFLGLPDTKHMTNSSLSQSLYGSPRLEPLDQGKKNNKLSSLQIDNNPPLSNNFRMEIRRSSLEGSSNIPPLELLFLDLRKITKITKYFRVEKGGSIFAMTSNKNSSVDTEENELAPKNNESAAMKKLNNKKEKDEGNEEENISNEWMGVPDILENDYIFSNLKSVGEKKEISEFHKWIDFFTKKVRNEHEQDFEHETLESAQIFIKKALELCFKLIGRNSFEKSKLLSRIWNENTRFTQEYLESVVKKIKAWEIWRAQELSRIQELMNQKNERSGMEQARREFAATLKAKESQIKKLEELIELTHNEKTKHELEKNHLEQRLNSIRSSMTVPITKVMSEVTKPENLAVKEKLFPIEQKNQNIDTSDLLNTWDRLIQTDFHLNIRDKNTQTDLLDVMENINDLELSPKKKSNAPGKGVFRAFIDIIPDDSPKNSESNDLKLDFEGDSPKLIKTPSKTVNFDNNTKDANLNIKRRGDRRQSRLISLKKSKTIENNEFFADYKGGSLSILRILESFEEKMKNFFDYLEFQLLKIASNNYVTDKPTVDEILNSFDSNKKKIKDFVKIISLRDSDNQAQLMNSKIEAAENQMELKEYKATADNWQKRFNRFYRKYLHMQDILLYEDREARLKADKDALKTESLIDFKDVENLIEREEPLAPSSALLKPPSKKLRVRNRSSSNANPAIQLSTPALKTKRESLVKVDDKQNNPIPVTKMKEISFIGAGGDFRATKKKIMKGVESVNGTAAIKYMRKLKGLPIKPLDFIKPEILLRLISALYTEIFKNEHRKNNINPLFIYLYDYLLNRYGNSFRTTELKMTEIIRSCLLYENIPRIRIFLKLLTIFSDPFEFDGTELNFYMECMTGLDEETSHNPGLALVMSFDKDCLVPFKNAHDFCLRRIEKEGKMASVINMNDFTNDLKACKEEHFSIKSKSMINADLVFDFFIFQRYCYWKKLYGTIFKSLDVLKENYISLELFQLWYKALEKLKYDENKWMTVFDEEADYVDEDSEKKYLGFKKFSLYAEKYGSFTVEKVAKVENSYYDSISNIRILEVDWPLKRNLIKLKYLECQNYSILFQKALRSIDTYFEENDRSEEDDKLFWMRYRMIDEDSQKTYIETQLIPLVPLIFLDIQFIIKRKLPNLIA